MTFVAMENNTKLIDPLRNLEILRDDSLTGSAGYLSFRLLGKEINWQFYARLSSLFSIGESVDPADRNKQVWVVFSIGVSQRPEIRSIIKEAMIAFRSWFGIGQENWTYEVRFETKDGLEN